MEDDEEDLPRRWSVRVSRGGRLLWRAASEVAQRMAGSTLTPAQVLELVAAEAGAGATAAGGVSDRMDPDCLALLQRLRGESVDPAAAANDDGRGTFPTAANYPATTAAAAPEANRGEGECRSSVGNEAKPPAPSRDVHVSDAGNARSTGSKRNTPALSRHVHVSDAGNARSLSELVAEAIRLGGERPLGFLTEDSARELEQRDPLLAAFYLEEFANEAGKREASDVDPPRRDDPECTIANPAWFEKLVAELGQAEGFAWMTTSAPAASPTAWLEAELARLDAADPHTIDARLREVRRSLQSFEFELAALLREAADRRLYRSFHFSNLELYVESRLGLSARTTWSLLAVEKATRLACPMLGEAWRDGHASWLAARLLAPVVSAAHGGAWIERAQMVTLRRLEAEIVWAQDRRDRANSFEYPAPPPLDLNLGDIVADTVTIDGLQMRAQGPEPGDPAEGYRSCVQIEFFAPGSIVDLAEEAMLGLRCGSEPRGRVFERMLALAMLEWMSAPAHRDPVFARDGWRCAVPGCSSRRSLHDHHIVFRSLGGGNQRDNRVTVCAAHHLHGLHRGRVRARGAAPHDITWEIGCRFGGDGPLARLFGDRYV